MDESLKHHNPNPSLTANPLSKLFFWWCNPLFKKGYVRQLEVEDMYNVVHEDQSDVLGDRLEHEWLKEVERTKDGKRKPSLFRALFRMFGLEYLLMGLILFLEESTKVIQPLLLGGLIRYFTPDTTTTMLEGYLYAGGVSLCAIVLAVAHHPYFFGVQRIGMKMRVACCSLLYRKSLRLSNAGLSKTTTGQIVNLMSNDVNRFDQAVIFLHFLWIGPLEAIAVLAILWHELGPSTLAGFAVLLFLVPVQGWMGKLFSKFRQKTAKHTDERVRVMNEIISGMRVIKMYCWEKPFGDLVAKIRGEEMKYIEILGYIRGLILGPFFVSVKLICLVVFVSFSVSGGRLQSELVFKAIALYTVLRLSTVLFMSFAVQFISDTSVSLKRIQGIMASVTFAGKQISMMAVVIGLVLTGHPFKVDALWIGIRACTLLSGVLTFAYPRVSRDIGEVGVALGRFEKLHVISGMRSLYFISKHLGFLSTLVCLVLTNTRYTTANLFTSISLFAVLSRCLVMAYQKMSKELSELLVTTRRCQGGGVSYQNKTPIWLPVGHHISTRAVQLCSSESFGTGIDQSTA